jgi:hypothetical protein
MLRPRSNDEGAPLGTAGQRDAHGILGNRLVAFLSEQQRSRSDEDDGDEGTQPSTPSRDGGTKASPSASRDAATSSRPAGRDASTVTSTPSGSSAGALIDAGTTSDPLEGLDALFGPDSGLWAPPAPPGPAAADNPKECPETAPENPIGSCIGVPVYATCNYGSYSCLCDWIHWLCI